MSRKALAFGAIAGLGIAFAITQPSHAQQVPSSADLLRDPQSQDSLNNLFNNRGDNPTGGLMDLIQRVSNPTLDPELLRQQQQENLDAATANFLKRRQQLLQTQTAPVAPAPVVQPLR
ncbi:hypothetical protein ACQ4M3_17730 [Leptolyngbya sp. AN03gr2]|uniref:hypothetical protein n=1 Tax=unclassified Leptolyngbya TaxID=2650499 RepID=UPI003D3127B4